MNHKPERAKVHGENMDNNVKVCVRVRPSKQGETVIKRCITVNNASNSIILDTKPECKVFSFDYVADEFVTQGEVFNMTGKGITEACMSGYNATIFAYGQTGSGKTWTIQGATNDNGDIVAEQRGLIPRVFEYLFQLMKEDKNATYLCKCSFLEIYNEQITDLLSPSSTNLSIHENLGRGGYVEGLKEEVVQTAQGAYNVLMSGIANRHVGYTAMNAASSRSHSVLTLSLESRSTSADGLTHVKYSRLNLIDLAGSERQKTTDTVGLRLKEAGNINKSLSALGNVIRALVDVADGKPRHVHYRDSKLTYLLKDSLGGNSKTCIIATVSPADSCFGESLSTLKFAQRAKMIKNMAVVNENSAGSVIALQAEVRRLREELLSVAGHRGSSVSQSGKFDRLMELEELLSKSIDDNADLRQEMTKLEMYIDRLKVLSERKDNFVMNSKLVIRLRETQLSKLEQRVRDSYAKVISPSAAEEELREEVNALRSIVELHPEVTRFAMENLELRDSIAKLDSMSDSEAQIAGLKNHIQDLSNQLGTLIKEKHDLMKGDSDKEKTEAIMALRMKLDSQTMDLEEKNEHISLLSAEVERAKNEQICSEQTLQQIQKEMAQKEKDIQDMMILTDEAFQQKKGSTEKMWMAKIQKLQEDFREKDVAHQQELKAQEETVARLRLELAQSQVVNRRLSTHVSFPAADAIEWEEDDFLSPAPRRASSGFPLRDVTSDQMREMQEKIDKFMEEIAQLKEERDTFTDEIKFLRDREQEQNERKLITSNDDEIVSLKSKMAELCEENNSMMDKYSELQGQVLQSHVERDELEDSYKAKLGHIESELCTYKSLLSEKDALIYQLQESASTVAQINITQHVDDAPASTRSAEEDDALTQELREKRAEIDALQIEVAKKTTSLGELLSTVAQEREKCTKLEHELSERSTQHAEAQKKIIELEQECKQLQEDIESANELDLSNIYERQVKKLSAENVALQTKIQELGRAVEEKTAMDAMTQQLRGDNEDLRESLGRMELDVQRLTADTVKLQEDLRMAAERVDVVRQELDEANRAATEAKQEAAEAKRETVEAKQEAAEAKQEAAEAKQEAAEAKQEAVEAKQEADRAKEEAKEARQEATSAKQEVEKTKQHDMNEAKQEVEKAKQEVAHIREELRTALESAATQQQHATRHQEHITELEQAKVDLLASHAKELETTRTEKDDLLVRANHAEAQLAKLNAQLREETQKYAELLGHQNHQQKIRHTQQLKTQIDKLQEENQRLKKELAKLRDGTINKSSAMPSPSLSLRNGATKATDSLNTSLNTSQVLAEQDNTHNIHNVSTTNAHVLHLVEAHVSMASPLDRLRHSFSAKEKEAPDHKEPTKQERGDPPTHLDLNNKENIFP